MQQFKGLLGNGKVPYFRDLLAKDLFLKAISEGGLQLTKEHDPEEYKAFQEGLKGTMETCWQVANQFDKFLQERSEIEEREYEEKLEALRKEKRELSHIMREEKLMDYSAWVKAVERGETHSYSHSPGKLHEKDVKRLKDFLERVKPYWDEL
jgi:bisphosphoglycerate-dependent phosphoglycerate mutase